MIFLIKGKPMIKPLSIAALMVMSPYVFANEQKIEIKNSINVESLLSEEAKYVQVYEAITDDMMKNGFYFKVGGKEIGQDRDGYTFEVQDIELYMKRSAIKRNLQRTQVVKSKVLHKGALNKLKSKIIIGPDLNRPQVCFKMDLRDKEDNTLGSFSLMPMRVINTEYFVPYKYWDAPPNKHYLEQINSAEDVKIQLYRDKITLNVQLEHLALIHSIAFRQEACKPLV